MFYKYPFTVVVFLIQGMALAQYQSEAPGTIEKNSLQAEVKLIYEKGCDDDNLEYRSYTHPSLLLRYGIIEIAELQMNFQYISEYKNENSVTSGIQPLKAGLKIFLNKNEKQFPAAAFLVNLSISPLASEDFRANNIVPEIIFTASQEIKSITACCNLGLLWDGETADPLRYYDLAVSYFPSNRVSLFAESFGFLKSKTPADNRLDAGISLFFIRNFQLDISAGTGLSKSSPDSFFYFGIAYNSAGF